MAIDAHYYLGCGSRGGREREIVYWVEDMQKTTGTLNPGAHPGSYNGQDAYNDMLIADGIFNAEDRTVQAVGPGIEPEGKRSQRQHRFDYRGGAADE